MTPARLNRDSSFARNLLAGGSITPCRDAPAYVADRRSLIAGVAIYLAIGIMVLVVVVIGMGMTGRGT